MTARRTFLVLVAACSVLAGAASAHEVRPAYLELNEIGDDAYDLLWKVPAKGDRRLSLDIVLPENCASTEKRERFASGAHVQRWRATCDDGLIGGSIAVRGLSATRTDVLVRIRHGDESTRTLRLTPEQSEFLVTGAASAVEVAGTYLTLGVEHILFGIDHLLFVLALLFLVGTTRRLIGTVTAFTIAHSITLAAAALGWIHVPTAPVEAVIALSIVFVAVEILHARAGHAGLAKSKPWIVAFAFGLLHGLGFAGALSEVGLPERAIPIALAFFNVGVEIGQLTFVAAAMTVFWLVGKATERGTWGAADSTAAPAAYAIGVVATYWLIERTVSFAG